MIQLTYLSSELTFPPVSRALASPNGLLAVGGDLSLVRLKLAYQQGIFPWFSEDEPILWWSPDPRAVLPIEALHVSRSMKKFIKNTDYYVTLNHAFSEVIAACAENREDGTWITEEIQQAYINLHRHGLAHSVEVWQSGVLIGGLYGVAQGQIFCGESMFSRQENASKLALITFARYFQSCGGRLFDCQILNPHTKSLGAQEISRHSYLSYLKQYQEVALSNASWHSKKLS